MIKILFSLQVSLWWLAFLVFTFFPLVDSSLAASDVVLSYENGGSSSQLMSPEAWTMNSDTLAYSPSVSSETLSCSSITNTDYTNITPAKTRVHKNADFSFSLTITTGDSNYVLILGFCDDGPATRRFGVKLAGTSILPTTFDPGNTVGTCKVYEVYALFTLTNSGTKITLNSSTITLTSTNVITITLVNGTGQDPIINYTILVKGDCSKANYCSMCNDQLCTTCNVSTRVCSTCISGTSLINSKCSCIAQYYYNFVASACQLCDQLCSTCAGGGVFACTTCTSTSYYLINTVCLIGCPYGYSGSTCGTSPTNSVINVNFNQDFAEIYGIFNTGTSSSTYQFFVSPDSVDPIPSYLQGFYFSSTSPGYYLASSSTLWLSHTFSIALWAYTLFGWLETWDFNGILVNCLKMLILTHIFLIFDIIKCKCLNK
ncbi:unnamed protein product [Blepharisma stoltei]|uniref:TNFR-Cys domain-containing protein n=1 Tax=Blepharisma stoltei TaxID=1481888 RepID=A0AAU9KRJ3_9CILI|nr:unnamed protein product [Blepharisma stoltei]